MFLSTILLALIVGALAGGGIPRLADLKLRWTALLVAALLLRLAAGFSRELDIVRDVPVGWLYIAAYGLISAWLWGNWRVPGLQIAAVGIGANMIAVLANDGQMPIWAAAFRTAGFSAGEIANDPFHFLLTADSVAEFVASGGLFGDVIPLPLPVIRDVISIGDVLLALGIFWAIVYSMTRAEAPTRSGYILGGGVLRPATAAMGTSGAPYAESSRIAGEMTEAQAEVAGVRRQSPYLRLARNRNYSLLWVGQLVSLFGERIHTVALGFLVLRATGSVEDVGWTFAATAVPNIRHGPLAGALVDRWDRRLTMIGCDLVRAALVLAVPFLIEVDVIFVYIVAFVIATVTLLFRPAKTALVPEIVEERDLVPANSATSFADGVADLIGLPLAGVLVASLGSLELAFAVDAGTYVVSGLLLVFMAVPRRAAPEAPMSARAVWGEMVEGWRFLTHQAELFSNTVFSTVAQLAVGAEIVVTFAYAERVIDRATLSPEEAYGLILAAIAAGSVIAGIGFGAIGERAPKGLTVIIGFVGMGTALALAGLVTDLWLAMILFFVVGLANMLFIIPTITLFQQRTPDRLMGRVVSSRQALVFGAIAASMAVSGVLADAIGPSTVLVLFGAICAVTGLIGLLVRPMRNAR
jgi:MFS family permease